MEVLAQIRCRTLGYLWNNRGFNNEWIPCMLASGYLECLGSPQRLHRGRSYRLLYRLYSVYSRALHCRVDFGGEQFCPAEVSDIQFLVKGDSRKVQASIAFLFLILTRATENPVILGLVY